MSYVQNYAKKSLQFSRPNSNMDISSMFSNYCNLEISFFSLYKRAVFDSEDNICEFWISEKLLTTIVQTHLFYF